MFKHNQTEYGLERMTRRNPEKKLLSIVLFSEKNTNFHQWPEGFVCMMLLNDKYSEPKSREKKMSVFKKKKTKISIWHWRAIQNAHYIIGQSKEPIVGRIECCSFCLNRSFFLHFFFSREIEHKNWESFFF